ncbi:uncharacterized protein LOC116946058 [Petromyzon marinus]|uniref:Uncharacterized protein LOC116946058 n=1 Tax=Petromyzon marinus TaxID=7757 RepID=A0AAJ7X0A6_PETMA|nr:uncharacterized protein LOC116946058 [Petromyzon marinus]
MTLTAVGPTQPHWLHWIIRDNFNSATMMGARARSSITFVLMLHAIYLPGTFCLHVTQPDTCVLAMEGEHTEIACSYVLDKSNNSVNFKNAGSMLWERKQNTKNSKKDLVLDYQREHRTVRWGQNYKDVAKIPNATSDSSCTLVLQRVAIEHEGIYTFTLYAPDGKTVMAHGDDTKLLVRASKREDDDDSGEYVILIVLVVVLLVYSLATTTLTIALWLKVRLPLRIAQPAPEAFPPSSSTEIDTPHTYTSLNASTPQTYSDLNDLPQEELSPRQAIATAVKKKDLKKVRLQMEVKKSPIYENIKGKTSPK